MTGPPGRRRGFALITAVFALALIGALISGAFLAATQEFRSGRNTALRARSAAAAEYGLRLALTADARSGWPASWSASGLGDVDSVSRVIAVPGTDDTAWVRALRLGADHVLVTSEGRAGRVVGAAARARYGILLAVAAPSLVARGALTARGATEIAGDATVDGADSPPAGWGCPPPSADLPGVGAGDAAGVQTSGCTNGGCVRGAPAVQADSAAADTMSYFRFGRGLDWAALRAAATIVAAGPTGPSVLPGGACDAGDPGNWGDPTRNSAAGPCDGYFPVLYAPADLRLSGPGRGQGILLVEGSLTVTGDFQFAGVVILRDRLVLDGTGARITGAVLTANLGPLPNRIAGGAVVYSSCVLRRVGGAAARPTPLAERSWMLLP